MNETDNSFKWLVVKSAVGIPGLFGLSALALGLTFCLCLASPALALDINGDVTGHQFGKGPFATDADAAGGVVNLYSGTVSGGSIVGGAARNGNASGNSVNLYGGRVSAAGGFGVWGGYADASGNADNNRVLLDGATVEGVITGGLGGGPGGRANNNVVTLRSGTVKGDVTGGQGVETRNNIINLHRGVVLGGGLIGGIGTTASGNTLNVFGWSGEVGYVTNFQNYNFVLPNTAKDGDTIIKQTTAGASDLRDAKVTVNTMGGGSPLRVGDTVTLISKSAAAMTNFNLTADGRGVQGISRLFTYDLTPSANSVQFDVTSTRENPQLKSLAESRVGGMGMLTQGADMLSMQGIPQLRAAAAQTSGGPAAFATMGGSSLRYDSGSHVDVDGFNLVTGLGWNFALNEGNSGNLLLGVFFEAGWGSYDSHNSFGNAASVKGDGDTNYYGGGILARYDSAPIGPGNLYLEASGRAGKVDTDYDTSDMYNALGGDVDFDSSATYYGTHAGLGYIWNITEKASLDLYTKYLWTHQGSDSVTVQGDRIKFKSMDSHRWRGGARFGYDLTTDQGSIFTPYVGAAYEYEFDSKARASSNGNAIDSPNVEGGTGMGELGLSFKPSVDNGLSFDLGLQGYTGQREGITGSFQLKYEF